MFPCVIWYVKTPYHVTCLHNWPPCWNNNNHAYNHICLYMHYLQPALTLTTVTTLTLLKIKKTTKVRSGHNPKLPYTSLHNLKQQVLPLGHTGQWLNCEWGEVLALISSCWRSSIIMASSPGTSPWWQGRRCRLFVQTSVYFLLLALHLTLLMALCNIVLRSPWLGYFLK